MIANLPSRLSNLRSLGFALVGAAGLAFVIGAALLQSGPDLAFAPEMAPQAVEMPDGQSLYVQRFEVTISEWNTCVDQSACSLRLKARPDQDPDKVPATGLNYVDVQQYLKWINDVTKHDFRLPTAAEWATMAKPVLPDEPDPIFTDPELTWASSYLLEGLTSRALKPQGSFSTSPQGVVDLDGSVWEWTSDCFGGDTTSDRCAAFYVGGEHVAAIPFLVRDPARGGCAVGSPPAHLGLRLVTDTMM